jgi:glycerate kinase
MRLRVLVVPDKFKGTLSAREAADAIAAGWRQRRPADELDLLPMSDGGDGFGTVISALLDAEVRVTPTVDAARRPIQAAWGWAPRTRTAIVESAQVIGLALLPPKRFHPFALDTFGLGAVLEAAAAAGAQRLLMGLGGSATNDGGFGVARAVGWTFLDQAGQPMAQWTDLIRLAQLRPPDRPLRLGEVVVAVDVRNPLLGPTGATRVYGPQKGLQPQDFELAEACLERLAAIARAQLGVAAATEPGAGAAGGLGFGLRCFLGARLESGFELFARLSQLEDRIRQAQLVLTGEGAIDDQSVMGKGVGEVAALCRKHGVRCVGLAGLVSEPAAAKAPEAGFERLFAIVPALATREAALEDAAGWLVRLSAGVAHKLSATLPPPA